MLRYLQGQELGQHPRLAESMFTDRRAQFRDRMNWDVTVDDRGWERDVYDALDPLYVIWEMPGGGHGGSMRFLPSMGRTMVNEHFAHLLKGHEIRAVDTWECTRFCLGQGAGPRVAAALMAGGAEIMRQLGLCHFIGVFDARMERIYRRIGSSPRVLGSAGKGRERISVGRWSYAPKGREALLARAGIDAGQAEAWMAQSGVGSPLQNVA